MLNNRQSMRMMEKAVNPHVVNVSFTSTSDSSLFGSCTVQSIGLILSLYPPHPCHISPSWHTFAVILYPVEVTACAPPLPYFTFQKCILYCYPANVHCQQKFNHSLASCVLVMRLMQYIHVSSSFVLFSSMGPPNLSMWYEPSIRAHPGLPCLFGNKMVTCSYCYLPL